ncbi:phage tail tip protein J-related protein, partial [Escherichia coli]|uniref:phage tail tip protein J-related protein n=2 Tax=Escherichia coli TaxID=562 RepID=UPI003D8034F9
MRTWHNSVRHGTCSVISARRFRINAPAAPAGVELTPGYFQITAVPRLAVYDPTVQFEFWFSEAKIADAAQVETS